MTAKPLILAALLGGLIHTATALAEKAVPDVLATVNGNPITKEMFGIYFQERLKKIPGTEVTSEHQLAAMNELINLTLMAEDAAKRKLDKNRNIAAALKLQRDQMLTRIAIQEYTRENPPSDADVRNAYDARYGKGKVTEYKARHILLKKPEDAAIILKELDKGADFAEAAKKHSTGPAAKKGGELDWFQPDQMVPAFSKAVAGLKKGSYTREPVQTPFGWHIIRLEDERKVDPPSFEQAKSEIGATLRQQKLDTYIGGLREKAKVVFTSDQKGSK